MQRMSEKRLLFALVAAICLIGVWTSLGSSHQPSNVLEVIEKTQAALEEASINLAFVEEQVEQEEAIVEALKEAFRAGENPEVIALEVETVVENLGRIEEAISDIAAELDSAEITSSTGEANLHRRT